MAISFESGPHDSWWVQLIVAALGAGFGALIGSWISFDLERHRRTKETHDSNIAAANLALSQLFQYWYQLFSYKIDCIEPASKLDLPWLKGSAPYPKSLQDFITYDLKAISIFSVYDHDLLPALLMAQTNQKTILDLVARRHDLIREISEMPKPPIAGGAPRDEAYWTIVIGGARVNELKQLFQNISTAVDQEIETARSAFLRLYDLMVRTYPKSKDVIVSYDFDEVPVRTRHKQPSETAPTPLSPPQTPATTPRRPS